MSIIIKVALGIGAVLLVAASICVTIAALFPPKEYNGELRSAGRDASTGGRKDGELPK